MNDNGTPKEEEGEPYKGGSSFNGINMNYGVVDEGAPSTNPLREAFEEKMKDIDPEIQAAVNKRWDDLIDSQPVKKRNSYKSMYEDMNKRYESMTKTAALGWLMFIIALITLIGRSL